MSLIKSLSQENPVLICGAGLAGLACGSALHNHGVPYFIFDSLPEVGGRIQTVIHNEGFILDKGFQVLLSSYPELKYFMDMKSLDLKSFDSGAIIFDGQRNHLIANPLRHPRKIAGVFNAGFINLKDKFLVLKLLTLASSHREVGHWQGMSTLEFLKNFGFSTDFIGFFWKPFLSGIYLDSELLVDSSFFLFLIRCFGMGSVTIPSKGMLQIPLQMAKKLDPKRIFRSTLIQDIQKDYITLEDGTIHKGSFVVKAFNDSKLEGSDFSSESTFYFTAEIKPDWGKWLVLVPPHLKLNINHLALLSEVSPEYSPSGKVLISANVVGSNAIPSVVTVASEIEQIAMKKLNLRHLHTDQVLKALPHFDKRSQDFSIVDSVYHCGDHLSSPSIQGALKSGRATAEAIIKKLLTD